MLGKVPRRKGFHYNPSVLRCKRKNKRHGKGCKEELEKKEQEDVLERLLSPRARVISEKRILKIVQKQSQNPLTNIRRHGILEVVPSRRGLYTTARL